jgi:hypothetical protein
MVCFQAHRMEYMLLLLSHGAETFGDWIQWYAQWLHAMCLCKCQEVCVVDAESTSACMCFANVQVFGGIIDMWSSILCAKPQDPSWHKKECLLGECPNCGIQNLKICSQ